jgi:hypothetical protein
VLGELVIRPEPRDEHVEAQDSQDVRPCEEVHVTDVRLWGEAVQGHLREHHGLLPSHPRLLEESFARPLEQVEREQNNDKPIRADRPARL